MTQISNIDGKIYLALKGHLDGWSECPVHYSPDVPQTPAKIDPYLIVTDLRLDEATRYVSASDTDEYRGILNVSAMVPMQWTGAQGMGLASRVCDYWPRASWHEYDDCRVQVMRRPKVIGTPYQDHGMQRFNVQIEWRAAG